ncbi:DNA breaking-rejoining enzyme, partial [Auriscalpium vulgare]
MLPKDMKVIMEYLDGEEAASSMSLIRRLYFKAFAKAAFNLWTRNEELVTLQWKNVSFQGNGSLEPYISFNLVFRKTNKDPAAGKCLISPWGTSHALITLPPQPDDPEIDVYPSMREWITHLQDKMQRPLQPEDYVFPALASTDLLKFGEPMSRTGIENILDRLTDASGVMEGRTGKFTTHCFRRGGAQYRFMFAEHKWSMKAVKWWGGWSAGDDVGTVMRYLLDELSAYEEGFSDIMMKSRNKDRHESFMGGSRSP